MANTHKMLLFCTLINHVETDEGYFIPAGTPVQVLQRSDKGHTIWVRCHCYMHGNGVKEDKLSGFNGAVNKGLHIQVDPKNLQYEDSFIE